MSDLIKRPQRLFRFFSPWDSRIFAEQKLWFSTASDFNDIFEAFPRYESLIESMTDRALRINYAFLPPEIKITFNDYQSQMKDLRKRIIEESNEEYPEAFQEKFSLYYGIVSFTEHLNNLLMWGHYTRCHRGFAIEFDPKHSLFTPRDFGKVVYQDIRPEMTPNTTSQRLLCKSSEWKYEDEHRIIKLKSELVKGKRFRDGKEVEGHFLPLPMDAIKAVYFGSRIEKGDRDNLLKPLEAYPHIERFFMRRSRIAYQLDVIPWKEWKEPTDLSRLVLSLPWSTRDLQTP